MISGSKWIGICLSLIFRSCCWYRHRIPEWRSPRWYRDRGFNPQGCVGGEAVCRFVSPGSPPPDRPLLICHSFFVISDHAQPSLRPLVCRLVSQTPYVEVPPSPSVKQLHQVFSLVQLQAQNPIKLRSIHPTTNIIFSWTIVGAGFSGICLVCLFSGFGSGRGCFGVGSAQVLFCGRDVVRMWSWWPRPSVQ